MVQHTLDRIFTALTKAEAQVPQGFTGPENVASGSELFVGYLLLDALIVNTDRHHGNWAVITVPNRDGGRRFEIAPTFDHASSLGRELTDQRRLSKLKAESKRHDSQNPARRDQTIVGYLEKDSGRSRIYLSEQDAKPMHPMHVFQKARDRFPNAAEAWIDRIATIDMRTFETIVSQVPPAVMSQPARDFCLCLIELNRAALIARTFQYA